MFGGDGLILTLCDRCLEPFLSDPNYSVKLVRNCTPVCDRGKHDCECDICKSHGHDYDVNKIANLKK